MAADHLPAVSAESRRIAAERFDRANQVAASGNFDYAIQLLLTCARLDPANFLFRQTLRRTQKAKYKNNLRGSRLAFLTTVLEQTTEPLFLVQDGAPYHRAAVVKAFFEAHRDRLHVIHLPSYSPDYNPIEFLWRATKRTATHNRYFPEFAALITSVEQALATLSQQPERVKALFGLYLDQLGAQALDLPAPPHAA